MSIDWLSPVFKALDTRNTPVDIFFRDDDAGWDDQRLFALLDCFEYRKVPVDLAVIPQAIEPRLADSLLTRWQQESTMLGLHQHGFGHCNHESTGRKCEFGPSRSEEQQYADLQAGWNRLKTLFGAALDPIFTPPWNRCNEATFNSLVNLGFRALSRNHTASSFDLKVLPEISVDIDWTGIRSRSIDPWTELGQAITDSLRSDNCQRLGIMLHHAVMDSDDLWHLQALLNLLSEQKNVRNKLMRECLASA